MWIRMLISIFIALFAVVIFFSAESNIKSIKYEDCDYLNNTCTTYAIQKFKYDRETGKILESKVVADRDDINNFFYKQHKIEDFCFQIYIVIILAIIAGSLLTVDIFGKRIYADKNLVEQIDILKNRLDELKSKNKQALTEISELKTEISRLSKEKNELITEYQNLEAEYNRLESNLLKKYKKKEAELQLKESKLNAFEKQLESESELIKSLQEEAEQKVESYKTQMKNIIQKAENNKQVAINLKRELKFLYKLLLQGNIGFARRKLKKLLKENKIV